jgi:hypothetical protein
MVPQARHTKVQLPLVAAHVQFHAGESNSMPRPPTVPGPPPRLSALFDFRAPIGFPIAGVIHLSDFTVLSHVALSVSSQVIMISVPDFEERRVLSWTRGWDTVFPVLPGPYLGGFAAS